MPAILHLLLASSLLASTPPAPPPSTPAATAKTYTLVVSGGSGGGQYPAQAVVNVWSNPAAAGSVFDHWSGDIGSLVDKSGAHTQLVMPAAATTITATYHPAPPWSPAIETISGGLVAYFFPPQSRGLVMIFGNYDAEPAGLYRTVEARIFLTDLVAAGYAVAVIRGGDRDKHGWDLRPRLVNRDIRHVRDILTSFTQRKFITDSEPTYAVGIGLGGNFVPRLAFVLRLKAVAVYLGNGTMPADSKIPTIWLMAQNDERGKVASSGDPLALDNYTQLARRGVTARYNINDPSPVFPLRFVRIPGLDAADSAAIYKALKDGGFLDQRDYLKQNPESTSWVEVIPARLSNHVGQIREQLEVCYSARRFFSDFDHRVIEFFTQSP